jgi:coproporphyrinogen III oxidase-like Fe-S oxidoreductase
VERLREEFEANLTRYDATIRELADEQLVEYWDGNLRLTPRGRLLSNEVFEKFILNPATK